MRFLYKLILLLSVLTVLNSLAQFIVFDKILISDTDALLLDTNEQAANNISTQLSENFKNMVFTLKVIAADENFIRDQEFLDKINSTFSEVDVITVLNKNGDILLVSGNQYNLKVSNLSKREYFQQAIQGKTYISDVFTSARGFKVVSIAVPILRNDTIDGVVVGLVKLHGNSLASMFDNKTFGRNGYISVVDRQGNIIYHPSKERIGDKAIVFDQLIDQRGSKTLKDSSGKEYFVGYSKVPELDWTVTVNTPTADIIKNRNIIIYEMLLLSIIGIAVVVFSGIYIIRRYTRSLDHLIGAFNSLKEGNYQEIDPCSYKKEFHEIVAAYNSTIEQLKVVHQKLESAADVDSLTGAYNRRAFDNQLCILQEEINSRNLENIGILLVDIDHFKELNDTVGHSAGDNILKDVTQIMKSIAGYQSVFRFGGDEFVVILRNTSEDILASIAETIRFESEKSLGGCTVSIGVAKYPRDTLSLDQLIEFADIALYISKKRKNKVTVYKK